MCLSLHYNENNKFYLFFSATAIFQFKAKESDIKPYTFCVEKISKSFAVNNMKTELNGYLYNFSFDYNTIGISEIIDNNKYLMKKEQYKINFRLLKQVSIALLSFTRSLASMTVSNLKTFISLNNNHA